MSHVSTVSIMLLHTHSSLVSRLHRAKRGSGLVALLVKYMQVVLHATAGTN